MNEEVKALLNDWHKRMRQSQWAHYDSANKFQGLHYWLGIPIVVLTTLVGAGALAALRSGVGPRVLLLMGALSICCSILAALQTFMRFSERAERHRVSGAKFGIVKKNLEQLIAFPPVDDDALRTAIDHLREVWNQVVEGSPTAFGESWSQIDEVAKEWTSVKEIVGPSNGKKKGKE